MRRELRRSRPRRGVALVAALALLALSAALLAGTWTAATSTLRSIRSERAALEADAHVRRATAVFLGSVTALDVDFPIGTGIERELSTEERGTGSIAQASGRLRLQRLDTLLFALAVDVRIGGETTLARRRLRVLLERPAPDSAAVIAPPSADVLRSIAQWSASDLY